MEKTAELKQLLGGIIEEYSFYVSYIGIIRDSTEAVAFEQPDFAWSEPCLFVSNFQNLMTVGEAVRGVTGRLRSSFLCLRKASVYTEALDDKTFFLLITADNFKNLGFISQVVRRVRDCLAAPKL